jgi:hypothetical protein
LKGNKAMLSLRFIKKMFFILAMMCNVGCANANADELSQMKADVLKEIQRNPNANVVMFPSNVDNSKLAIVGDFEDLKNNKNAIGAIYVKKSRLQVMFITERLIANNIKLSPSFQQFIITESQLKPVF